MWGGGKKGAKPPRLIEIYMQCRRWGSLPMAGGLYDQPAGLLAKMGYLWDIAQAHKEHKKAEVGKKVEWIKKNPHKYKLIRLVRDLNAREKT